jgi:hypothetical protein
MGRAFSMHGEKRNSCKVLDRKLERKRPLERPRCKLVDNNKMDLRETGRGSLYWNDLSQDRDR